MPAPRTYLFSAPPKPLGSAKSGLETGLTRRVPRVAAGFLFVVAPVAVGRSFHDVSNPAGLIDLKTRDRGDLNNDGFVSVHELDYLAASSTPSVYLNNKDGPFTDIRSTAGLVQANPDNKDWLGFAFCDYDGNLDFFAAEPPFQSGQGDSSTLSSTVPTRNILYRRKGDGTFVFSSDVAGLETRRNYGDCGFFVDYDNDGKLDLFVKNIATTPDGGVNVLYHNNGDGTFTQVSNAAGLANATHGVSEGAICSFADYDNDGRMDVVMGDNGTSEALYRNVGGTFVDVTAAAGLPPRSNSNGFAWGEYDSDGFLYLFVARPGTDQLGLGNANLLYHSNGDGTYTERAAAEGVALEDNLKTSACDLTAWGDYDNDGFLDLDIQHGVAPTKVTRSAATGYRYLLRNSGNGNHFLKVNLKETQSNRFGIGARVTATYAGGKAFRENNGGGRGEYASQGSEPLHFGIGSANSVSLDVAWPSGHVDTIASVAADSTITVTEGSCGPPVVTQQPRPATVNAGQAATFKVKATGATRANYTTPPATPANNGTLFAAAVSDNNGTVSSNTATLKVVSGP